MSCKTPAGTGSEVDTVDGALEPDEEEDEPVEPLVEPLVELVELVEPLVEPLPEPVAADEDAPGLFSTVTGTTVQ